MTWGVAGLWVVTAFVAIWICRHPKQGKQSEQRQTVTRLVSGERLSVEEETQQILMYAAHLRDQLQACAERMVELYDEPRNSDEADELMGCVFDGADFNKAMKRIMRIKLHKHGGR